MLRAFQLIVIVQFSLLRNLDSILLALTYCRGKKIQLFIVVADPVGVGALDIISTYLLLKVHLQYQKMP